MAANFEKEHEDQTEKPCLLRNLLILHGIINVNKTSFNCRRFIKSLERGAILTLDKSGLSPNTASRNKKSASVRQADGQTNFNQI